MTILTLLGVTDHQVVTFVRFTLLFFGQLNELDLIVDEVVMLNPPNVQRLDSGPGCKQILREDVEDAGGCLSGAVWLQEIGSSWGLQSSVASAWTRRRTCGTPGHPDN